jgi:hypothetical protein
VAARRRIAAALGAIGLLVGLFPAPVALAADPAAGFSANWTVTPPAGVTRAADSIAVGDDFSVWFAAVDATPVTSCRVRLFARGGEMMSPMEAAESPSGSRSSRNHPSGRTFRRPIQRSISASGRCS